MNALLIHAGLVARHSPFTKVCSRCGLRKGLDNYYSQGGDRPPRADCKLCFKISRIARSPGSVSSGEVAEAGNGGRAMTGRRPT